MVIGLALHIARSSNLAIDGDVSAVLAVLPLVEQHPEDEQGGDLGEGPGDSAAGALVGKRVNSPTRGSAWRSTSRSGCWRS